LRNTENLDVVRARAPGGDELCRRKRAGDGELLPGFGEGYDFKMQAGTDDELGAAVDGGFRFFGGRDGAGPSRSLAPYSFFSSFSTSSAPELS